jgi:hypothetical protein
MEIRINFPWTFSIKWYRIVPTPTHYKPSTKLLLSKITSKFSSDFVCKWGPSTLASSLLSFVCYKNYCDLTLYTKLSFPVVCLRFYNKNYWDVFLKTNTINFPYSAVPYRFLKIEHYGIVPLKTVGSITWILNLDLRR